MEKIKQSLHLEALLALVSTVAFSCEFFFTFIFFVLLFCGNLAGVLTLKTAATRGKCLSFLLGIDRIIQTMHMVWKHVSNHQSAPSSLKTNPSYSRIHGFVPKFLLLYKLKSNAEWKKYVRTVIPSLNVRMIIYRNVRVGALLYPMKYIATLRRPITIAYVNNV